MPNDIFGKDSDMTLYLIRHGQDDNSVRGGWSSSPLTPQGVSEAEALSKRILNSPNINITKVFSSDLVRAKQTAEIIASKINITVELLPQFRETNNGALAGMKNDIAVIKFPGIYWNTLEWDEPYPDGESPHQFFDRISIAWNDFKNSLKDTDGNVILVTHGGVINVIYHIENKLEYSNKTKPFPIGHAEFVSFII